MENTLRQIIYSGTNDKYTDTRVIGLIIIIIIILLAP